LRRTTLLTKTQQWAGLKQGFELTRGHWGMENGLHYKRDVTLGEDASRVRRGAASQVMAALRNTVVHLLDATADNLAAAMRTMSNCFNKALALLGLPQLE